MRVQYLPLNTKLFVKLNKNLKVSQYTGYRDIYILPRTPNILIQPVALDMIKVLSTGFFGLGQILFAPFRVELDKNVFIMGETIRV